jgi:hypothetical protein
LFPLKRLQEGEDLPEQTSAVSWRREEMLKGDVRPRGAIRS